MAPPALATMTPPKAQIGNSTIRPHPRRVIGDGLSDAVRPALLRNAARPPSSRISRLAGPSKTWNRNMPLVNIAPSLIAYRPAGHGGAAAAPDQVARQKGQGPAGRSEKRRGGET